MARDLDEVLSEQAAVTAALAALGETRGDYEERSRLRRRQRELRAEAIAARDALDARKRRLQRKRAELSRQAVTRGPHARADGAPAGVTVADLIAAVDAELAKLEGLDSPG